MSVFSAKFGRETHLWLSWVDDCIKCGPAKDFLESKKNAEYFNCEELGELDEYTGCKIDQNCEENLFKFTQPVLLQSFEDALRWMSSNTHKNAIHQHQREKCYYKWRIKRID